MTSKKEHYYSIKQVIDLTGISEFTLRGWEGRYQAISPRRTPSGRRNYTENDIEKIRLLLELVELNYKIGNIAKLTKEKLKEQLSLANYKILENAIQSDPPSDHEQDIVKKILIHDYKAVEKIYITAVKGQSVRHIIFNFIIPLIRSIAILVDESKLSIAQEHFLSSLIIDTLQFCRAEKFKITKHINSPLVLSCPEGDHHEIGLLIADVICKLNGIKTVYLGAHCPSVVVCEVAQRTKSSGVISSMTLKHSEGAKHQPLKVIHFLDSHLPKNCRLIIGTRHLQELNLDLKRPFLILRDFQSFDLELKKL